MLYYYQTIGPPALTVANVFKGPEARRFGSKRNPQYSIYPKAYRADSLVAALNNARRANSLVAALNNARRANSLLAVPEVQIL